MQDYILPQLENDPAYCEQFYVDSTPEPDYQPLSLRKPTMRRTFHFDCPNGQLNVSECPNDNHITLSIKDAEVTLDFDTFNELCGLKYTLNLLRSDF